VRTWPDPEGRSQDRRDLADVITTEQWRDQEDDVDRSGRPLINIRQLNVVAQPAQAPARFL
jgi:hypothetical protein